jgi:hypothetical protein
MLAAAEVNQLGPLFHASQALNLWITGHCPDAMYVGTFWALCLSPLVLLILLVSLWPSEGRWRPGLFLALIFGALLLARLPLFCYDRINPDEAFFLASAMRVPIDAMPYRSFDGMTSGPLNVYAQSIPAWFGASLTYVSSRLTGVVLVFGTLAFLWLAYRRLFTDGDVDRAAALALMPAFCFYVFAWDSDFTHCSTEHVAIFLSAAVIYLLAGLYRGGDSSRWRIALIGILAGSMMFAKLQALPMELTLLAIAATIAWGKPRPRESLAALAGGAVLVPAVFLTMFLAAGVLPYFCITYFRHNAGYTGQAALSAFGRVRSAAGLLFNISNMGAYELGLMVLWTAGLAAAAKLWWTRKGTPEKLHRPAAISLASLLLLAVAGCTVAAPGRRFMHYELFLVAPSGLATVASFLWLGEWLRGLPARTTIRLQRVAAVGFVLLTCVVPTALRGHIDDAWDANYFDPGAALPTAIRGYTQERDTIAVWGWRAGVYVASGRASSTRFADSEMQMDPSPRIEYYRNLYLSDLERSKPVLFIDAVGEGGFTYTDRSQYGYETFDGLRQVVTRDYQPVGELDGARLFIRKDRLAR